MKNTYFSWPFISYKIMALYFIQNLNIAYTGDIFIFMFI